MRHASVARRCCRRRAIRASGKHAAEEPRRRGHCLWAGSACLQSDRDRDGEGEAVGSCRPAARRSPLHGTAGPVGTRHDLPLRAPLGGRRREQKPSQLRCIGGERELGGGAAAERRTHLSAAELPLSAAGCGRLLDERHSRRGGPAGGVGKNGVHAQSPAAVEHARRQQASKPGGWLAGWPVKHSPVSYLGRVGRAIQRNCLLRWHTSVLGSRAVRKHVRA